MHLSTYTDYSFRVLMYAASRRPERVTVTEVASVFEISRHHLSKVVHNLGRSGYLRTQRGKSGGFTLARSPAEIRLGDIMRLVQEKEIVIGCGDKPKCPCRILPVCRLKSLLDEAARAYFAAMDGYTLADLAMDPSQLQSLLQI